MQNISNEMTLVANESIILYYLLSLVVDGGCLKLMQFKMVSSRNIILQAVLHGICCKSSSTWGALIGDNNFLLLGPFHFISSHLVFSINCWLPVCSSKMVFSSCNKSKKTIVYYISCVMVFLVSSSNLPENSFFKGCLYWKPCSAFSFLLWEIRQSQLSQYRAIR